MSEKNYDLLVIGSGPGGYVAALRGAQLGLKTAIVEKGNLGGTCLNVGCIPSKALLHSTELHHAARHDAARHGLKISGMEIDLPAILKQKDGVVNKLRMGVNGLLRKRKVDILPGLGCLAGEGRVNIENGKNSQTVSAKEIVIATGSSTIELPFMPNDGHKIVSSDEAIAFDEVPGKLVIIGAGAIGLELGSVWARLGSEVTVVEMLPQIAPLFDTDVATAAQKLFEKQGLKFSLCTSVKGCEEKDGGLIVKAEKDGKPLEFPADRVLVAVGRKPNTEGLHAEKVGLEFADRGRIKVDQQFRTNIPGIRAIGDVTDGPMLAHRAEEEGVACAEIIAGKPGHVNYDVIPGVVYTDPEIAMVGLTEEMAKEQGRSVKVGKFPFMANGRALATDATDGFVKIVADAKTDKLLGAQILGHGASEQIANVIGHMEYGGSAEDLGRTIHAHPTMSEAIKEAALAVDGNAIHMA